MNEFSKISNYSLFLLSIIFFQCQTTDIDEVDSDKLANDISNDPLMIELMNQIRDFELIPTQGELDLKKIDLLREVGSEEELRDIVYANFNEPEHVLNNLYTMANTSYALGNNYPELINLSEHERTELIENVIANSMAIYYLTPQQVVPLPETDCPGCEASYNNAVGTCFDTALFEGAVCGLSAPTIGPALFCGAVVIGLYEICKSGAANERDICRQYDCN